MYFKELVYMMMEGGKSDMGRVGQQAGNSQTGAGAAAHRQDFLIGGTSALLLRPSPGWMGPRQIIKWNLLSLQSAACRH